jgi:arylsulfatase A-like enzyme
VHSPWHSPAEHTDPLPETFSLDDDAANLPSRRVYQAMVRSLDDNLGRLRAELQRLGVADHTAIIFTSDNGGVAFGQAREFQIGPEPMTDQKTYLPVTTMQPLRGQKGTLYEGGIRVPWVFFVPNATSPGTVSSTPISTLDLWPTLCELARLDPGDTPRDGRSLTGEFRGEPLAQRSLFFYSPVYSVAYPTIPADRDPRRGITPQGAVIEGRWKLIHAFEGRDELYDLRTDPAERLNLAEHEPQRVETMRRSLMQFLDETGAQRLEPNPFR